MAQKILIAEDESILRDILKNKIKESGYEAITASDGEEAVRLAKEERPDMLVVDIVMPKKNGFEVMEELNRDGILPVTIVVSNSGDVIDTGRAYKLGAKTCIVKANFEPDDVLNQIELLIGPPAVKSKAPRKILQNVLPKVLIIEDEAFIRDLLVQKLQREKFEISVAEDGEAAVAILEGGVVPDLVLLDIVLPGMSGFEVLQKMKLKEATRSIPVIILSNLGQKGEIEQGLRLGADKFLIKANLLPNDLIKLIQEVLQSKSMD